MSYIIIIPILYIPHVSYYSLQNLPLCYICYLQYCIFRYGKDYVPRLKAIRGKPHWLMHVVTILHASLNMRKNLVCSLLKAVVWI